MADIEVVERTEDTIKVEIPRMYKVVLHNDDTTHMDFVVMVLISIFHKSPDEAADIAMEIHKNGKGVAGAPYTKEIAIEKVVEVETTSKMNGFVLACTHETL